MPKRIAEISAHTILSDQRGFPIVGGVPDIGAYEAGTLGTNYNAYIWETLPTAGNGLLTDPLHATTFDFDGDGQTNQAEWLALTDAADSTSYLRVTQTAISGNTLNVTFPTVIGRNYSLEATTDLANPASWTTVAGSAFIATGTVAAIPISPITGIPKYFLRVRVGP